jgi:hypothetical protein
MSGGGYGEPPERVRAAMKRAQMPDAEALAERPADIAAQAAYDYPSGQLDRALDLPPAPDLAEEAAHPALLADRRARLDEAATVGEAREAADIRKVAEAVHLSAEAQNDWAEYKLDAERKAGRMLAEHEEFGPGRKALTLRALGLERNQSSRWQLLAELPPEPYREYLERARAAGEVTEAGALDAARAYLAAVRGGAHVGNATGDPEWFTRAEIIAAAVAVMGAVDLDPASTPEANEVVRATTFYTAADDGLAQPWAGRIWLNPPFKLAGQFCDKLAAAHAAGDVPQAIILTDNSTDTRWWWRLAGPGVMSAVCFPRGRARFWHPDKNSRPIRGQMIAYLGPHTGRFCAKFARFGRASRWNAGEGLEQWAEWNRQVYSRADPPSPP